MPKIPDPKTLRELELSAKRYIEDREWKKYQRYLAKHKKQNGNTYDEDPLSFEDFCVWLAKKENSPLDMQNPL